MALVSLDEARSYLRVDSHDEDALIGVLLASAGQLSADVARLTPEQREAVESISYNDDGELLPTETDEYSEVELAMLRAMLRTAVLFALGYLYEHREEADHADLAFTLRALLSAIREGVNF